MQAVDRVIKEGIKVIDFLVPTVSWIFVWGGGYVHKNAFGIKSINTSVTRHSFRYQCLL